MKQNIFLISLALLVGCATGTDWSHSGVPGIFVGQSKENVMHVLNKNGWIIHRQSIFQEEDGSETIGIIASGKPSNYPNSLFGNCRAASMLIYQKKGLQVLEAVPCSKLKDYKLNSPIKPSN